VGNHQSSVQILTNYFSRFRSIVDGVNLIQVAQLAEEIQQAKARNGNVFVCGNGGSAALASHFVTDIGSGSVDRGECFPMISLVDGSPALTAAANDFGYEHIFSRQLKTIGTSKDLLIVISSSGNSQNLIEAIVTARTFSMKTCGLLGFDGGKLRTLVDVAIVVESAIGEYGPIEDSHSCVLHAVTELLRKGTEIAR
jgi:D-sedoheptulose 7-phosphate isomerase